MTTDFGFGMAMSDSGTLLAVPVYASTEASRSVMLFSYDAQNDTWGTTHAEITHMHQVLGLVRALR